MRAVRVNDVKGWLETRIAKKLGLWLLLSLILSVVFFRDFWTNLPVILSPDWVLGQNHASLWGVLALCLIFLWLKRKEVRQGMSQRYSLAFIPVGLALIAGAVFIPSSLDYLVFSVLLASLGVFVIFFGKGAKIPSILLAIYGFSLYFPFVIQRFADRAYSGAIIAPMMWVVTSLGYPLQNEGQWVHFTSTGGESVSVAITSGCAGPATMGVFIALFALMMLDMPLPPKKAVWVFLFGAGGTWFQNFIRLVFLMLVGYYLGESALWTGHSWSIYILFPLWYLLFAYVYFWQVGRLPKIRGRQELKHVAVPVK